VGLKSKICLAILLAMPATKDCFYYNKRSNKVPIINRYFSGKPHMQGAKCTIDYFNKHQTNIKEKPQNPRNLKPFAAISRPLKHQININL